MQIQIEIVFLHLIFSYACSNYSSINYNTEIIIKQIPMNMLSFSPLLYPRNMITRLNMICMIVNSVLNINDLF